MWGPAEGLQGMDMLCEFEAYEMWKMFDHIFSTGQWVKQMEYTVSVAHFWKTSFGRNKHLYRYSVGFSPSCTSVHACSFWGLLPFPVLSESVKL